MDLGNVRNLFPPKTAALALSIKAHFHEVRGESGNAILAYQQACEADPANPNYAVDRQRYREHLERLEVETRQRATALTKMHAANRPAPARPSSPAPSTLATNGLSPGLAMASESRGLQAEREGKWAEAQAAFATGHAHAPTNEPRCWAYLHRVVRKEILAGQQPIAQATATNAESTDRRLRLPRQLQALIWAVHGRTLEAMGRFAEASRAFAEACQLAPENPTYSLDLGRAADKRNAKRCHRGGKPTPAVQPVSSPARQPSATPQVYTINIEGLRTDMVSLPWVPAPPQGS